MNIYGNYEKYLEMILESFSKDVYVGQSGSLNK